MSKQTDLISCHGTNTLESNVSPMARHCDVLSFPRLQALLPPPSSEHARPAPQTGIRIDESIQRAQPGQDCPDRAATCG